MTSRVSPLAGVAALMIAFTGCAGIPAESADSSATSSDVTSSSSSGETRQDSAEPKRSETSAQTATASKSDSDGPRSSWRAEREAQRDTRSAASGGNPDTAKLVEQLNDASRELATLRAANAKLRAERAAPERASTPTATVAARPDPVDEKLAASLKSYAQFRQEVTNLFSDLERMRKENAGLSSNLKSAVEQTEQARSNLARLESELRAEKRSRADAEQTVAQLREQLRTIARAMAAAGINVDKLSASAETARR